MMKPVFALAALALCIQPVYAADTASTALATKLEGVYKYRFQNGMYDANKTVKYESEDVVEIVAVDDTHVYVRADLQFFNGHECGISGIANFENGAFVYHSKEPGLPGEAACTLTVSTVQDKLHLSDRLTPDGPATCSSMCGARGSLSDYSIPLAKRKPIRYLPRLKASREYAAALKEAAIAQP
ncbi:MAG: hypothetical protein ACJ8GW_08875 [Massilia sp.]